MSKKLVIPRKNLPDPSVYDAQYRIRYRLVSEDRNRFSSWTPIFSVNPKYVFMQNDDLILVNSGSTVSCSWGPVQMYINNYLPENYITDVEEFDIFIKWAGVAGADEGDWTFYGRVPSKSVDILIPLTYTKSTGGSATPHYLYVEIFRPSREQAHVPFGPSGTGPFRQYWNEIDLDIPPTTSTPPTDIWSYLL